MERRDRPWDRMGPGKKAVVCVAFVFWSICSSYKTTFAGVALVSLFWAAIAVGPMVYAMDKCFDELPEGPEAVEMMANLTALEWQEYRCEILLRCGGIYAQQVPTMEPMDMVDATCEEVL